jgi:putative hydrolase of HD superfamily
MEMKDIVKLLFETGMLGRVKRSGDWLAGVKDSESISEHSHRAAIFGYILAKLENADENKVLKMLIFHDLPETRLLDRNKVSARYYNIHEAEKHAFNEQMSFLPQKIGDELRDIFGEMEKKESKEAIIAKDAD